MENFKASLNKCGNTQFDFVKLDTLEQGKKYEVTFCESFDTEHGKTITVVLDNKIRVFLPNRYFDNDEMTDENISLYKNSKTKFNLIYKGMKKLNKGKSKHLIDFE